MKRILSLALCLLMLFSMGMLAVSAEDTDALWKKKQNYEYWIDDAYKYFSTYYVSAASGLVFFYTDTAAEMKFELQDAEDKHPDDCFAFMLEYDYYYEPAYVVRTQDERFNKILLEYSQKWNYSRQPLPMLWAVIHELDISKEEFIRANERAKNDWLSVRELFPELTDDEIKNFFKGCDLDDFVIDALYVEDENLARNLLCTPWSIIIDGEAYTLGQLALIPDLDGDRKHLCETFTPEQLKTMDQHALYYFLEYVNAYIERCADQPHANPSIGGAKSVLDAFSPYSQDLPETGDNTPIFAALIALPALGLGMLAVKKGKKRREQI